MGWADNREQGLTGRKRPCAPRSSQLQTSITMIIYPGSQMHRLHVPSATRKQALHRQIYGHMQPGPGGKASLPLVLLGKGGKKQRKEKSVFCITERTIYNWAFVEDSVCCLLLFFFSFPFASVACLNEEWECINHVLVTGAHIHGPIKFLVLWRSQSKSEEWDFYLALELFPQGMARTTCFWAWD
jgi:hypothetical protein